jgi:LPXTG-site transpeptidase (sortase) family protein
LVLVAADILAPRPATPARLQVVPPASIIEDPVFPSPPTGGIAAGTRIVVPDLGIDLPVVAGDGENAPLYKAATFPGLKLPGEGGRSLIYAHARTGMFGPLFRAHTGERVEIHEPGGRVLGYTIRQYYPSWSSLDLKWLQPANHEELVLVTCTTYNINDPRIIAVAEPA